MLLVGNIVISILIALSIIIVGLFELLPVINPQNQETQLTFFKIVLDYAIFAFIINFVREIAKDIEEMNTLPIAIGRERAGKILFVLSLIPLLIVIYYVFTYLYKQLIVTGYFLLFIIAPLIYVSIKLFSATTKKDYHSISILLKVIMIFGMLSLLLYKYILLN